MHTEPQRVEKHQPKFEIPEKTPGERWHEEVENENPILAGIVFALTMGMILAIVVIVGGSQPANMAYAEGTQLYKVTPSDKTNWKAQERVDHQRLKDQWASVKVNLDDAKRIEAEKIAEEEERLAAEAEEAVQAVYYEEPVYYDYNYSYSPVATGTGDLRYSGVESDGEYTYTWYSQNILPGNGLDIPGRHVGEGGYVMDGDDNIVVASSDLAYGTEVETPYGNAKVYDSGCASSVLDVYTNW